MTSVKNPHIWITGQPINTNFSQLLQTTNTAS